MNDQRQLDVVADNFPNYLSCPCLPFAHWKSHRASSVSYNTSI